MMTSNLNDKSIIDSSEIPHNIIRLLFSGTNDKRNQGLKELESYIKATVDLTNGDSIDLFIRLYKAQIYDKIDSQNVNAKRATMQGLVGISNLIKAESANVKSSSMVMVIEILVNILKDSANDSKLPLELIYNLDKILKNQFTLILKCFSHIFEAVIYLSHHHFYEVREAIHSTDELLKDVISQADRNELMELFNVNEFLEVVENSLLIVPAITKVMLINWVKFLDLNTDKKLLFLIYKLIPSVFPMLNDSSKEVINSAEQFLKEYYKQLDREYESISIEAKYNILSSVIQQGISNGEKSRMVALEWICLFLDKILEECKKPEFSITKELNKDQLEENKEILLDDSDDQILQLEEENNESKQNENNENDEHDDESEIHFKEDLKEFSPKQQKRIEFNPSRLSFTPYELFGKILEVLLENVRSDNDYIVSKALKCNDILMTIFEDYTNKQDINVNQFYFLLKQANFSNTEENSLELLLKWIRKLFSKFHAELVNKINSFLDLSNQSDKIFNSLIDLLCEMATYKPEYEEIVFSKLFEKMSYMKPSVINRTQTILKKLASALTVEKAFITISNVLYKMKANKKIKEREFMTHMITNLDIFLLTFAETETLRSKLKTEQEDRVLFKQLFPTWCFNPVSLLTLCITAENFELSYHLILKLYWLFI